MKKAALAVVTFAILALALATLGTQRAAQAAAPPFVFPDGCCFYNGTVVRTVVPPASDPQAGIDPFYGFPGAVAPGQKGVVGVAPGADGYHGGHWKFFAVTFNPGVTPFLLTSEAAILTAASAGEVTVTRVPEMDFKCPIQP